MENSKTGFPSVHYITVKLPGYCTIPCGLHPHRVSHSHFITAACCSKLCLTSYINSFFDAIGDTSPLCYSSTVS